MSIATTNWVVITGGSCCGKSKVIEALAFLGYPVRTESARLHIDEELSRGLTLEQIRADELGFQHKVIALKEEAESRTPKEQLVFWDRGMPDSHIYLRLCGQTTDFPPERNRYRRVFLMEALPLYQNDYARIEDAAKVRVLHEGLLQAYTEIGYDVIRVPVMPISQRVKFVLDNL